MQAIDEIERWARFVRSNKEWKHIHTEFINSQYSKHQEFLKRISKKPDYKKKIFAIFHEPHRIEQR